MVSRSVKTNIAGIPDSYTVTLAYVDNLRVSTALTVPNYKEILRGASAYDPRYALGGPSCINWAAYQALYNKYRVIKSNIKCYWTDDTATSHPVTFAIAPSNNATQFTGISQIMQSPYAKFNMQGDYPNKPLIVTNSMTSRRIRGASNLQMTNFESFTNNNPPDGWYWTLFLNSTDQQTNLQGYIRVVMSYTLTFFDRKESIYTFHTAESDKCYGPTGYDNLIDDTPDALVLNGGDAQHIPHADPASYNPIPLEGCTGPSGPCC